MPMRMLKDQMMRMVTKSLLFVLGSNKNSQESVYGETVFSLSSRSYKEEGVKDAFHCLHVNENDTEEGAKDTFTVSMSMRMLKDQMKRMVTKGLLFVLGSNKNSQESVYGEKEEGVKDAFHHLHVNENVTESDVEDGDEKSSSFG